MIGRLVSVAATLAVLPALVIPSSGRPAPPPPATGNPAADTVAVREAVLRFIQAIDRLDLDGVVRSYSEDATVFYPFSFTPHRLVGHERIRASQAQGFTWARDQLARAGRSEPYALNLRPSDMHVQMLGAEAAVVTWHSHRPTHAGRRTAVLHRRDGTWLIVSHHASNMAHPE